VTELAFLSPSAGTNGAIARSPMEHLARSAGARFEVREGWNVAVGYGAPRSDAVSWADVSHLRKWEVRGGGGELGTARREGDAWVCPLTPARALVIGGSQPPAAALEVTCNYAALTILGPQSRELIARFCALDLREHKAPPRSFRPGSVARQPGMILVEDANRFLVLFGWAVGEYMWSVVADAAGHLGGAPIGIEELNRA
jgi:glycine cleavage system aminomethyltransferase T